MCESCLPVGFFGTPAWAAALGAISGGRFTGPGDRRVLADTYVPLVAAQSDERTVAHLKSAASAAVSMDGATVNRQGLYNLVAYTPLALLYATGRVGSESPTSAKILDAIKAFLNQPILAAARMGSSAGADPSGQVPRLRRLCEERTPAVLSDSPSAMVLMRSLGVSDGTFVFGYGCAAHAGNLVALDATRLHLFSAALRHAVSATVFFMRCGRARAMHASTVAVMSQPGRRIRGLKAYSRTRWAGEAVTISAVQENLPALRHTLLSNAGSGNPFPVSASVTAALEPASRETIGQSTPFLKVLAAAVALLEAEAAPLSSYAGIFATLRSSLDTFFTELPLAAREGVQHSLCARFAAFSDPMVALAFYLDGFWGPARGRVSGLVWTAREGEEGRTLSNLRDAAIVLLADGDAPLAARLQSELSEFLAFAAQPARAKAWTRLHPLTWWRLYGERCTLWHPLCLRLFCYPASAAGGERAFKRLNQMLTPRRNRLSYGLVNKLTRIAFNAAQLGRPNPVTRLSRSHTELKPHAFFGPLSGEAGTEGGGGETVAGVGGDAMDDGGEGGAGLWGEEAEEEEPLPDLGAFDMDAIIAELLS